MHDKIFSESLNICKFASQVNVSCFKDFLYVYIFYWTKILIKKKIFGSESFDSITELLELPHYFS